MIKPITLAFLLIFSCNVYSQSNVRFEEVNVSNALSQNSVLCIHQDTKGFLWLGTYNGLNKFDGYKFKVYKLNESVNRNSSTNRIVGIREDRYKKMWITAYDGSMHRFDPETETFIRFPRPGDNHSRVKITSFYESKTGEICLTTDESGFYHITTDSISGKPDIRHVRNEKPSDNLLTDNATSFAIQDGTGTFWIGTPNGLNKIEPKEWYKKTQNVGKYLFKDKINNKSCAFTAAASTGYFLWFGTTGNGLMGYDSKKKKFIEFAQSPGFNLIRNASVTTLKAIGKDLWIGTSAGMLGYYNASLNRFESYTIDNEKTGRKIQSIFIDHYQQLWILTEKFGITRFNPFEKKFYYYELTPEYMKANIDQERTIILEDKNEGLWLGIQNRGMALYNRDKDKFIFYSNNPQDTYSLCSDFVNCIYEDREGIIWVGTSWFGKGLSKMIKIDPAFKYIEPVPKPVAKSQNFVRSIFEDSKGYLWAGTKNGEVWIYSKDYTLVHVIKKDLKINFSGHNVYSIYQSPEGYIWLCTKGGGIFCSKSTIDELYPDYKNISFINITQEASHTNSLSDNKIYDLIQDKKGRIWVATYGGGLNLLTIDNRRNYTTRHFTKDGNGLSSNMLRALYLDSRNLLWIATTNGINYIDLNNSIDDNFAVKIPVGEDLPTSNVIYSDVIMIAEDSNNNIWLATSGEGIAKLRSTKNGRFKISQFTMKEGLADDISLSLTEDKFGFIWVAGENGLSRYNPVNKHFEIFDKKNGLPGVLFSEKTCYPGSDGKLFFGSIDGLYIISPEEIRKEGVVPSICLTDFHLFNKTILPLQNNSPLKKTITYSREITLNNNQSALSIEFAAFSFKSPRYNQYTYILDGFDKEWSVVNSEHKATYTNIPPGKYIFTVKGSSSDQVWNNTGASLIINILPPFWMSDLAKIIYMVILVLLLLVAMLIVKLRNNLIIERKVAESKLRFFTNVSHEFKTPLTLILGPVERLIGRQNLAIDVKQQLILVHRNTRRLLRLVNQLLDFRKVQNGKMEIHVREINFIPFIQQIYESFKELARQKNIHFDFVFEKDNIKAWGDIQKLEAVIFNLLSNAFKFTPEYGKIVIQVKTSACKGNLEVMVSDTGIGIEAEKLPYIFDMFFVSHTYSNDINEGTGIGLSLVKEYIKLHKGKIETQSTLGEGTKFLVTLPCCKKNYTSAQISKDDQTSNLMSFINYDIEEEMVESDESGIIKSGELNKQTILLIEDDVDMAKYLVNILSGIYFVLYAKDGIEGWNKAKKHNPDLVITDVKMPRMDGLKLTQKLKEEFVTSHIPIIMLTAKSDIEDELAGLKTGADLYLSKPFNYDIFLLYIDNILKQKERIQNKLLKNVVELKPDEIEVASKDKAFIEKLIKHINDNISNADFNVEKLASLFDVSRSLFFKKVKGITGYQPVELIKHLRLKRASELLDKRELNITEVAYMVGFNDIRYFSTCFKKQFGINPSKYLIKETQDNADLQSLHAEEKER